MSKPGPFDYVSSINFKKRNTDLSGYVPFLTNRAFAMHIDTVLFAEQMNQFHQLSPDLQYDFYYHSIRKGKRFGFPPKPPEENNLEMVMEYFKYSRTKAQQALRLLTENDLKDMKKRMDKGG